jgi:hypothetical protein
MLVYILWVSLSLGLLDLAAVDQQRPLPAPAANRDEARRRQINHTADR